MNSCRFAQNRIAAYIDGELRGAEMLHIRSHLQACETCRREMEACVAVKGLVASLPCEPPGDCLEERLLAAVGTAAAPARHAPTLGGLFRWATAFAFAAAVAFAVFTSVSHPDAPPVPVHPEIAQDEIVRYQDFDRASRPFSGNRMPASWELSVAGR